MKKRKIAIVTGSRSEYGILYWLLKELKSDSEIELNLMVTGSHLATSQGETVKQIINDKFNIDSEVPMLLDGDNNEQIAYSVGLGIIGFTKELSRLKPDIIVILGDRFEIFAVATAAMMLQIPIAHIAGGETNIANCADGNIRNAITKMAHLHFVSCDLYKNRIISMGEEKWRVFNVGLPSLDNIKKDLLSKDELEKKLEKKFKNKIFLITYLPVGLKLEESISELKELLEALKEYKNNTVIFTLANADAGGRQINSIIENFSKENKNVFVFQSLGKQKYLSMMNICDVVIGNSSSGIIETPSFKKATVNIGERQDGRFHPKNVIDVVGNKVDIRRAIEKALSMQLIDLDNPFGDGNSSKRILSVLKKIDINNKLLEKRLIETKL